MQGLYSHRAGATARRRECLRQGPQRWCGEAVDEQGSTSPNKQQVNKQALLLLPFAAIELERLGQTR